MLIIYNYQCLILTSSIFLSYFSDCFLKGSYFSSETMVNALCGLGMNTGQFKTAHECQEQCRQCKACKFFAFDPAPTPSDRTCDLYTTSKGVVEDVRNNYPRNFAGPKVCGMLIFKIKSFFQ